MKKRKSWFDSEADYISSSCNFKAADVDEGILKTLSREDLLDLLPGPQNFLRRKKLWDHIHPKVNVHICG